MQPGESGRACDAAQPEHGQPLDVGPQPESRDEPHVQRWHRHACDRGDDQQVHVARSHPARVEGTAERQLTEIRCGLDVAVVDGADPAAVHFPVLGKRQDGVPGGNAGIPVQPLQKSPLSRTEPAQFADHLSELGLRVTMRRQGRADGGYRRHSRDAGTVVPPELGVMTAFVSG